MGCRPGLDGRADTGRDQGALVTGFEISDPRMRRVKFVRVTERQ
jgi:hypothetical protein